MTEQLFIEQRQEAWQQLNRIAHESQQRGIKSLAASDLQSLGPLYRRASSDLAYARTHNFSPETIQRLNSLVARGFALMYQTERNEWRGVGRLFRYDIPNVFRRRVVAFWMAFGFFVIGALVSYVLVMNDRKNLDLFISADMKSSLEVWSSGETSNKRPDAVAGVMTSFYIANNTKVALMSYALGVLAAVPTALIGFMNGALIGAFAGEMTYVHQHGNFWPSILPHGVVEMSAIFIAGGAGLSIGWAWLVPGRRRRVDALREAALDSLRLVILSAVMLIFAGFTEAFVSHSLLPKPMKIAYGVTSGVILYIYLFRAGRESREMEEPIEQLAFS